MVSFELGKETEEDVFRFVTCVGTSDLRIPRSQLRCSITEPQRLYGYKVHMTRVLHTARISNVDSVMFVNRIREMDKRDGKF